MSGKRQTIKQTPKRSLSNERAVSFDTQVSRINAPHP